MLDKFLLVLAVVYAVLYVGWVGLLVWVFAGLSVHEQNHTKITIHGAGVFAFIVAISYIIAWFFF